MRCDRRARLEIGFPSPVVASRSFLTRRSAALRSIGSHFRAARVRAEDHEPVHHSGSPDRVGGRCRPRPRRRRSTPRCRSAARPPAQTRAVNDGARQALQEAGGMAGGQAIKFVTLNDATKQAGQLDAGARVRERPPRWRRTTRRWRSSARSTRARPRSLIPITNEAGVPVVSPSNTVHRPHARRRRRRAGRAGQVLPDRRAHLLPHHAQRPRAGRRAGDRDARRGLQARRRRPRRRGLRRGRRQADARAPSSGSG